MFKRLSEPTGEVTDNTPQAGDTDALIVRPAILVHAGPEGKALTFQSSDGPISFDGARIEKIVKVHNEYMDQLTSQYGGDDKIPIGALEPILDSHNNESNDNIIGRLTGRLKYEVRDIPKVGKNVPCAVCYPGITFLGKDTVDRVKDGRIYHLSIGISEKTNRIGETSTVVKPAAPGAMLLKQGKPKNQGGLNMGVDVKRLKAHTERLTKLSAMRDSLGTFSKKLVATQDTVKLTRRTSEITNRLSAVCKAGKMTPAEYKKLYADTEGFKRLSKLDDDTLSIALMPYEARQEPVVRVGQFGSSEGAEAGDLAKKLAEQKDRNEYTRLRDEAASDFRRLAGKDILKKLSAGDGEPDPKPNKEKQMSGPHEEAINPGQDGHVVPGQAGDEQQLSKHMAALGKHLAEGNLDEAKKVHAAMSHHMSKGMKHMAEYAGDVKSEDYKMGMDQLQGQVDELNTQMARMAGMVEDLMSSEKAEGEAFEKVGQQHEGIGAGDGAA